MSFSLDSTHRWIIDEVAANRGIRDSMDRLIDRCEAQRPHQDWKHLRKLPYADISSLQKWIVRPFEVDPPSAKQSGLWFGLCNPIYDDRTVADIYVCGSETFEETYNDADWASGEVWCSEHAFAHSTNLAGIYEIAHKKDGLRNDAEYPLCLAYGALAVRDLMNWIEPRVVVQSVGTVGIAVGFDSGDFVLLGHCGDNGLAPFD